MVIAAQYTATFQDHCASPSITSLLVQLLWQTVEIGPLGHVRVVEALQNFVQKWDPVLLPEFHIHNYKIFLLNTYLYGKHF